MVPESSYSSSYLSEEPLDKSYDFISNCGQNSFYIKYTSINKRLTFIWNKTVNGFKWTHLSLIFDIDLNELKLFGSINEYTTELFPLALRRCLSSVGLQPRLCQLSSITVLYHVAAMRPGLRAIHANHLAVSAPAGPTWLAETARSVPPGTTASLTAGVSTSTRNWINTGHIFFKRGETPYHFVVWFCSGHNYALKLCTFNIFIYLFI